MLPPKLYDLVVTFFFIFYEVMIKYTLLARPYYITFVFIFFGA